MKSNLSLETKIPSIDSFQKRIIGDPNNASSLLVDKTTDGIDFKQQFIVPCYVVSPLFMGKKVMTFIEKVKPLLKFSLMTKMINLT